MNPLKYYTESARRLIPGGSELQIAAGARVMLAEHHELQAITDLRDGHLRRLEILLASKPDAAEAMASLELVLVNEARRLAASGLQPGNDFLEVLQRLGVFRPTAEYAQIAGSYPKGGTKQ